MELKTLSILISLIVLSGCSSSSSTSNEGASDSLGAGLTMRLISVQRISSNGSSSSTNYEYDEAGNLISRVIGSGILTYNIEPDGRVIDEVFTDNEVTSRPLSLYFYDETRGLRRIDNIGFIESVGVIGVSSIDLYKFENDLATSVEFRQIAFEDIVLNGQVDDSAGIIVGTTEFKYDGDRLIQELTDFPNITSIVGTQIDYTYNSDGTLASTMVTGTSVTSNVFSYEQGACNHNWGNSTHRYFCVAVDGM